MSSLVRDLSDGVKLIQLMVVHFMFSVLATPILPILIQPKRRLWVSLTRACMLTLLNIRTGDVSLGRYNKTPRMRVQKAENVNKALEFITSRGVKLTNIGPEGKLLLEF